MKPFIHDDFLLQTDAARELYHAHAKYGADLRLPLPPAARRRSLANHQFADVAEMWIGGDHYKWRAMRANGVDERFCTGDAPAREKFNAWVDTVPQASATRCTTGPTSS